MISWVSSGLHFLRKYAISVCTIKFYTSYLIDATFDNNVAKLGTFVIIIVIDCGVGI